MKEEPAVDFAAAQSAAFIAGHMQHLCRLIGESKLLEHWLSAHVDGLMPKDGNMVACSEKWNLVAELLKNTQWETLTPQQRYFPDYDCEMPTRKGWSDSSEGDADCPCLSYDKSPDLIYVWCNYRDPAKRWVPSNPEPAVYQFMGSESEQEDPTEFETDSWAEMERFLDEYEAKLK